MSLSEAEIGDIAREVIAEVDGLARAGVPEVRVIRRRVSARLKGENADSVIAVGLAIASAPEMKSARARWVGWELINAHRAALAGLDLTGVEALGRGNSSWDEVDGFGVYVAGPAWLRGLIGDADVIDWANSPDLWKRRTALVATVVLNSRSRGGRGEARRTLMIAERLVDDREDMVIKAMSWALRALVPWDRGAVESFLDRHESRLASRIKREVRTKLRTGRKNLKKAV